MATASRTSRIEARISPEALKVVRRAAEIQGRSVSDFVVAAAPEAAQRAVSEVEMVRLSSEAQEQFIQLLLNPPKRSIEVHEWVGIAGQILSRAGIAGLQQH